ERAEVNSAVSRAIKESDAEIKQTAHKTLKDYTKELTDDLKKTRKERFDKIDARFRKRHQLEELGTRQKTLNSAAPFFVDLPQSVATAKTDADGRFELTIPDKGEYVLVASAERTVFKAEDDLVKKQ